MQRLATLLAAAIICGPACAADPGARLLAAYPEVVERVDGNDLVLKSGRRIAVSDGKA